MRRSDLLPLLAACAVAGAARANYLDDLTSFLTSSGTDALPSAIRPKPARHDEMRVLGDYVGVNRKTGELNATGAVTAVSGPFLFRSDRITRDRADLYDLGPDGLVTTCTNDLHHLHWQMRGHMTYRDNDAITFENMRAYYMNVPCLWFPYYYQPLNESTGWRFLPGYNSRWGGYFLLGYVYTLYDDGTGDEDNLNVNAATYGEYRIVNGFAVGQQITWSLKQFGWGRVQGWYGWDEDYDRYNEDPDKDDKYKWQNWTGKVKRERWRLYFHHQADITERDIFRMEGQLLSDNMVLEDFSRRGYGRYVDIPANDMWYEHRENTWALGVDVSGPMNKFYAGTWRLPEAWVAVAPQPVFSLPVNYESQTRAGYLGRRYSDIERGEQFFRYDPYLGLDGTAAHYKAFRADTYHRLVAPSKWWDVLSVMPHASYRCTWWSDAGDEKYAYGAPAGSGLARHIGEAGVTASARATGDLSDAWQHVFEPYVDYTYQRSVLSSGSGKRHYYFDSYDSSLDWLDQFGFEGHNLPYSWHGLRPGIRNAFSKRDESGFARTILDTDLYVAVPFDDEDRYSYDESYNPLRGYVKNDEYGNAAQRQYIIPGFRVKYNPNEKITFGAMAEYDTTRNTMAYSQIGLAHRITKEFSWHLDWIQRDHRIWDYLATPSSELGNGNAERWNWEKNSVIQIGFRHKPLDWFQWGPYIQYDAREGEVERVGSMFDFLQDCIGYRVKVNYITSYTRIDGSRLDSDFDVSFFIFLRAFGEASALDLSVF